MKNFKRLFVLLISYSLVSNIAAQDFDQAREEMAKRHAQITRDAFDAAKVPFYYQAWLKSLPASVLDAYRTFEREAKPLLKEMFEKERGKAFANDNEFEQTVAKEQNLDDTYHSVGKYDLRAALKRSPSGVQDTAFTKKLQAFDAVVQKASGQEAVQEAYEDLEEAIARAHDLERDARIKLLKEGLTFPQHFN